MILTKPSCLRSWLRPIGPINRSIWSCITPSLLPHWLVGFGRLWKWRIHTPNRKIMVHHWILRYMVPYVQTHPFMYKPKKINNFVDPFPYPLVSLRGSPTRSFCCVGYQDSGSVSRIDWLLSASNCEHSDPALLRHLQNLWTACWLWTI